MIISEKEKKTTAYHEAGHALVARLLPGADPIHKVTIIPSGRALGLTMQLPVDEKYTHARGYLLDRIAILFGGRVAEEDGVPRDHHRRGQRHRTRDGTGAENGVRVGHERQNGAPGVRQTGRTNLPGTRN